MKTTRIIWGVLLLIIGLVVAVPAAPPPKTISYQGYLKDSAGKPVTAGTFVVFSLYSSNPASTTRSGGNSRAWRR